jgi:hypothetical protein
MRQYHKSAGAEYLNCCKTLPLFDIIIYNLSYENILFTGAYTVLLIRTRE